MANGWWFPTKGFLALIIAIPPHLREFRYKCTSNTWITNPNYLTPCHEHVPENSCVNTGERTITRIAFFMPKLPTKVTTVLITPKYNKF